MDETNGAGTTPGPLWSFTTGTTPGTGDAALDFDGTDDLVDLGNGDGVRVTGTAITLEARINPSAWRTQVYEGSVLNKEQNGPDNGYALRVGANGTLNFLLGGGGWQEVSSPAGALVLHEWQHVAATYDGATMRLYVDGEEVASRPATVSIADAAVDLWVGDSQSNPTRTFPGGIDEVRVWDRARTAAALRATMGTELGEEYTASPDSGLVGYWRFDEGSGQIAVDETAYAAHGTLGAGAEAGADDPAWLAGVTVGVEDDAAPVAYALDQNYPNPFARATTIRYALSAPGPVHLALYDLLGRRLAVLVDGAQPAGVHTVRLDGAGLPSGVYVYRLEAGTAFRAARRLVVLR